MHELFPGDMLARLTRQMDAPGDEPSYLFRAPNSEMDGVNRQDFAQLDQATQQRLVCQLRYRGKARTVQPYRLITQQGVWYVWPWWNRARSRPLRCRNAAMCW